MQVGIVLIGRAGAGKDTVASYLCERYGFWRYAFADKLKLVCQELFPEMYSGSVKPRKLLQDVGTAMRSVDPDVWVRALFRRIDAERPRRVVITDCRYRNELAACLERGFIPVYIECRKDVRAKRLAARGDTPLSPVEAAHSSENDVFDYIEENPPRELIFVDNNLSKEELYEQLDIIMEVILEVLGKRRR